MQTMRGKKGCGGGGCSQRSSDYPRSHKRTHDVDIYETVDSQHLPRLKAGDLGISCSVSWEIAWVCLVRPAQVG